MLREISRCRQIAGESPRRWFFSHEMDLVVWLDDVGQPLGFQLAYDKYRAERSIAWRRGRGFRHYAVADGESHARRARTPCLHADGWFPKERVIRGFCSLSLDVPAEFVRFVKHKLQAFVGTTEPPTLRPPA